MRIAMVSEHASPLAALGGADAGGQNVHVAALSEALAALGHEVTVYTRRDDRSLPGRVKVTPGVTVEHLSAGPPLRIPKDDIFPFVGDLAAGLRRAWMARRPDVVHAHFWMSGLAALQAAEVHGLPVLQTFHALGVVKRRHQGRRDTSPPGRSAAEMAIAHRATRIVATCRDELAELVELGADVERVSVVPCGVDSTLFAPACRPGASQGRRHRLVSVGRLVERKGVDDLVRALTGVPEVELVVAGGPERSEVPDDPDGARLARLSRELGVGDRVDLIGRLARHEVPQLLSSADLAVCVPWYEPFGIVPLEAMSCAVPVVASRVGGLIDTVVDGLTGVHVAPRRPAQLARTIRDLLDSPERRHRMGTAGRARVVERYQWSQVAEATLEAYEQALSAAGGPARRRRPATYQAALG